MTKRVIINHNFCDSLTTAQKRGLRRCKTHAAVESYFTKTLIDTSTVKTDLNEKIKVLSFPKGHLARAISSSFGEGYGVCPIIRPDTLVPPSDFTSAIAYVDSTAPYYIWRKGRFDKQVPQNVLFEKTVRSVAACEAKNRVSNRFFHSLGPWDVKRVGRHRADIMMYIREELTSLVKDFTPIRTFSFCHHGNGASENSASPLWKKMKKFSATEQVAKTLGPIYETLEGYIPPLEVTTAERFSTVDKTFKIRRPIGIQPSLNLYFQLGVGGWLKTQLRQKWKVDLRDQDRNRVLACLGSMNGALSTIDLSAASDTISRGVIDYYFDDTAFYEYISMLRTTHTAYSPTDLFENEKFSSMGNGFTFELETALFGAVVRACYRYLGHEATLCNFAVYGDDMIVLDECTSLVVEMLELHGFTVNTEKSFSGGPFRESCGSDYYLGLSVRNTFIKENFDEEPDLSVLIKSANALYRKTISYSADQSKDNAYRTWRRFLRHIPKFIRQGLSGPVVEHDQWLIGLKPSETLLNLRGEEVLPSLNASTKPVRCDEYLRFDSWCYLANRRRPLLDLVDKHSNKRVFQLDNKLSRCGVIFDYINYHPAVPTAAAVTYICCPSDSVCEEETG